MGGNSVVGLVWARSALVVALALVVGLFGDRGSYGGDEIIAWPSSCVGIAALLLLGRNLIPAWVLGNAAALGLSDLPAGAAAVQAGGNAVAVWVPATIIARFAPGPPWFASLPHIGVLTAAAACGATISAVTGAGSLAFGDLIPDGEGWEIFAQWWLGEASSTIVVVAAVLIAWEHRRAFPPRTGRLALSAMTALLLAGIVAGLLLLDNRLYLAFPALIWAGLRWHRTGAALASLLVAAAATTAASLAIGPFADESGTEGLLLSQGFIAVTALTALLVATIDEARAAAVRAGEEERKLLQEIVDASPSLIGARDLEGRFVLASRTLTEGRGELVGRTAAELFPPDVAARTDEARRRVEQTGKPLEELMPGLRGDRVFSNVTFPLRSADGRLWGTGAVAVDVTEVHRAAGEARRQKQLLERAQAMASMGSWEWDLKTGEVLWSEEMFRIYGLDSDYFKPLSESVMEMVHPDDREELLARSLRAVERGEAWEMRMRVTRSDGAQRVIQSSANPERGPGGELMRMSGFIQDITELVAAEEEARAAERRYRELVERLPAVLYVASLEELGGWSYVSPQIEQLLGYTPEEWMADPTLWERSIHPEDRERARAEQARITGQMAIEYRLATRDGRTLWVRDEAVMRDEGGELYLDGMLTDVTAHKEFETRLQYLADHDPLTGLFNRRRFAGELELEVGLSARDGRPSTLLVLDIDNFKYVNDSLGHLAGDTLIRRVAELLSSRLRATDTLARLGGDEFAALLRGASIEEAGRVSSDVLETVRASPLRVGEEAVRVTASVGLAEIRGSIEGAEEILAAADLAMYRAKQEGRDAVAVFTPELQQEIEVGRSWADRIRDALQHDRFVLFCQPITDLRREGISQWEVLVRMVGDDGEIVTPNVFLPVAERFGLIQAIDRWVILRSIETMEQLLAEGQEVRFEVNVSGASMGHTPLLEDIEEAIARSPVDPSNLVFEVTETEAIGNMDHARAFAERLARLGCRFALDDFGSGFASFYYLKHLPLDYVKIDGDFIRGLVGSEVDREIVTAMIAVTRALGLLTVAEFVGDQPTLELVRTMGVDYAQGYHVGLPRPLSDLTRSSELAH